MDLRTGAITGGAATVEPLTEQQRVLFRLLWDRAGALVTHDEVHRELWPGVALRPDGRDGARNRIKQLKFQLEQRLGEAAPGRAFLVAVRGKGLRLVVSGGPELPGGAPDGLVGRDVEREALLDRLRGPERLVWVHGVAGVGTSAVLRAVTEREAERRGAPLVWIDLRAGGVLPGSAGSGLLVVDHAPPAALPAVRALLADAPEATIVVGARAPGPAGLELAPLAATPALRLATTLLHHRLGRPPADATPRALVAHLGGFPGALVAAAELVTWLGEEELRRSVADDGPGPLRDAIAAGAGPLDPADTDALAAIATFAAPFSLRALGAVSPAAVARLRSQHDRGLVGGTAGVFHLSPAVAAALPAVARHVEAHRAWVRAEAAAVVPPARLGLPEARDRAQALRPELERVARGPLPEATEAVLALAELDLLGERALDRLDAALVAPPEALRHALLLARGLLLRRAKSPAADADLQAALDAPAGEVRARAWMALALSARDAGRVEEALDRLDHARREAGATAWIAGRVEANRVPLLGRLGRWEAAAAAHARAMDLSTRAGDLVTQARALGNRANQHRQQGELDLAYELGQRELAAHRALGDDRAVATALGNLAATALARHDRADARRRLEGAVEANRALGNRAHAATAQANLGLLACADGHLAEAAHHLASARSEHAELGNPAEEARALANHGVVRVCAGKRDEGTALLDRAAALAESAGAAAVHAWARALRSLVAIAGGARPSPVAVDPTLVPPWLVALVTRVAPGGRAALRTWVSMEADPELEAEVVRRMIRAVLPQVGAGPG